MEWRLWIESGPVPTGDWARCADALLDILGESAGVLGPIGWGSGDALGAVFEVRSEDLPQALAVGLTAFEGALQTATAGLEKPPGIRRLEIGDATLEPDELMGATDVARLLGISRQRVYQLSDEATFPAPAAHLARGALWSRADIEAWNDHRKTGEHTPPRTRLERLIASGAVVVPEEDLMDLLPPKGPISTRLSDALREQRAERLK